MIKYLALFLGIFGIWWITVDVWKVIDPRLIVVFCDVGQGDMILIKKGTTEVVVDWGPGPDKAKECLDRHLGYFDRDIELSVNSHPHRDHLWGLMGVMGKYKIKNLAYSGEKGADSFEPIWKQLELGGTEMVLVSRGDQITVGDMSMKVLWPTADLGSLSDINLLSVVFLFNYKSFDLFLPGDLERDMELAVVDSGLLTKVEVVKVAHHGSKTSSSPEMLSILRPALAVISAGINNQYGHPDDLVLDRFAVFRSSLLRTDKNGEVRIYTDGDKWWYKTKR